MKTIHPICIFLTLYIFVSNVNAQSSSVYCRGANTVIVYGNGVNSTLSDAIHSTITLMNRLESRLSTDDFSRLQFDIAYNETFGFLVDFFESGQQELGSNIIQFWEALAGLDSTPDSLKQLFLDLAASRSRLELITSTDLAKHVDLYKGYIMEGKEVVLVAHSQGNFFANLAYNNLSAEEKRSFEIVSVANPDRIVAGSGQYTTLTNDLLIQKVAVLGATLPPNITNIFTSDDIFNHNFISAYLQFGSKSEAQILKHILGCTCPCDYEAVLPYYVGSTCYSFSGHDYNASLVFEGGHEYQSSHMGFESDVEMEASYYDTSDLNDNNGSCYALDYRDIEGAYYVEKNGLDAKASKDCRKTYIAAVPQSCRY